jgi:hypothetical protein
MSIDLLDVEEGAIYLHVKSNTMRAWILKAKIPYVNLGVESSCDVKTWTS